MSRILLRILGGFWALIFGVKVVLWFVDRSYISAISADLPWLIVTVLWIVGGLGVFLLKEWGRVGSMAAASAGIGWLMATAIAVTQVFAGQPSSNPARAHASLFFLWLPCIAGTALNMMWVVFVTRPAVKRYFTGGSPMGHRTFISILPVVLFAGIFGLEWYSFTRGNVSEDPIKIVDLQRASDVVTINGDGVSYELVLKNRSHKTLQGISIQTRVKQGKMERHSKRTLVECGTEPGQLPPGSCTQRVLLTADDRPQSPFSMFSPGLATAVFEIGGTQEENHRNLGYGVFAYREMPIKLTAQGAGAQLTLSGSAIQQLEKEIRGQAPEGIRIDGVKLLYDSGDFGKPDPMLGVAGITPSTTQQDGQRVEEYVRVLKQLPNIREVRLHSMRQVVVEGQNVFAFELVIRLLGN